MTINAFKTGLLACLLTLPIAACSTTGADRAGHDDSYSDTALGREIHQGIAEARRELATQDIDLNHDAATDGKDLPKAVITARGDLVIGGKPVAATPAQHALLVDYRRQMLGIAEAGLAIGERGAELGTRAAHQAIWAVLTGHGDEIEARLKPQTDRLKAEAAKLCLRLPDVLATQQELAEAMPAFRPYASMTAQDIDDCRDDIENDA